MNVCTNFSVKFSLISNHNKSLRDWYVFNFCRPFYERNYANVFYRPRQCSPDAMFGEEWKHTFHMASLSLHKPRSRVSHHSFSAVLRKISIILIFRTRSLVFVCFSPTLAEAGFRAHFQENGFCVWTLAGVKIEILYFKRHKTLIWSLCFVNLMTWSWITIANLTNQDWKTKQSGNEIEQVATSCEINAAILFRLSTIYWFHDMNSFVFFIQRRSFHRNLKISSTFFCFLSTIFHLVRQ